MQVWLIPIADETQRVQVSSVPAIDGIFRRLLVLSVPGRMLSRRPTYEIVTVDAILNPSVVYSCIYSVVLC